MSLFAQHGYGKSNKIEKAITSGDLTGVVLSPKAESPQKLIDYSSELHSKFPGIKVYFDPQFYICGLQGEVTAGKLIEYPYYTGGLTRASLSIPNNLRSFSQDVLGFQNALNVDAFFSPTIAFDSFDGRESQTTISLAYESIGAANTSDIYISLCIHESSFRNTTAMEEFLNVISLLDTKGFYIIIERTNSTDKSTSVNSAVLANIMKFIYILSEINGFDVIMGYSDLLSVLFAAVGHPDFCCGWYNNLKMFSESNFRPSSGGRRPRKRYTSGILMSSLLLVPEIATLNRIGISPQIMTESPYNSIVSPTLDDASWTDEISCLHNWHILNSLLCDIEPLSSVTTKLNYLTEKILQASNVYRTINERFPSLDAKSNNSHLNIWLAAISDFRDQVGV